MAKGAKSKPLTQATMNPQSSSPQMSVQLTGAEHAIQQIGGIVAQYRARQGQVQRRIAEQVYNSNRSEIAELEEGKRLPSPDKLEQICEALKVPREHWYAATHPDFLTAMTFQHHLCEMLGKPLSLDRLGPEASFLAIDRIAKLLKSQHSAAQAFDAFRSVLTFYGERAPTQAFFDRFLGASAFRDCEAFGRKVREFLAVGLRLFGNFRRSWKRLSQLDDLTAELSPLDPVDESSFTQRRPFKSISQIPSERLDDLGYISADRARKDQRDRKALADALESLAADVEKRGPQVAISALPGSRQRWMTQLLKKFDSSLDLSASLFAAISGASLRDEAARVKPSTSDLDRIAETQLEGLKNLCKYLSEPFIDVYVATSMRDHSDFVAVNNFVESVFQHGDISSLQLRYFNPTQSWIEDRVAKGLVEALMLRRSRLTIYMAQRADTFGKDSEASVALGQGKSVVVYVPQLFDATTSIDSKKHYNLNETELRSLLVSMGVADEEGLEHRDLFCKVMKSQLERLSPPDLARILLSHWADFDLPGEVSKVPDVIRKSWSGYFSDVSQSKDSTSPPIPDATLRDVIVERLVDLAAMFERRAALFRDTHPLALQVIVDTGVLNGMMVVRTIDECAKLMYRIFTNRIETEVRESETNYSLCEKMTGSPLRVVSKFPLLTNAFWTQYFEDTNL